MGCISHELIQHIVTSLLSEVSLLLFGGAADNGFVPRLAHFIVRSKFVIRLALQNIIGLLGMSREKRPSKYRQYNDVTTTHSFDDRK